MASFCNFLLGLCLLAALSLHDIDVQGAAINGLTARSADHKKIVHKGDQLFLVSDDEIHKRSANEKKKVIRFGDELVLVDVEDDDDDQADKEDSDTIRKRAAIKDESYRWAHKTMPYIFDNTYPAKDQAIVREAMDEWSRHTCVRFRPATAADRNKVKFTNGDGCFSFVGMVNEGTQEISLATDGCRLVDTALHEIGHALGMYHTQVRPDRDKYIKIDLSDVKKDLQDNFIKQTWQKAHHYGVDYDFRSIMHYDGTSFTSNGGMSIKTLDPKWQKIIGHVKHLSFGDIEMMNKMYHCAPGGCTKKDSDCPGTSFVDQQCQCACPGPNANNPVVPCSGSNGGGSQTNPQPQPTTSSGGSGSTSDWGQSTGSGDWEYY